MGCLRWARTAATIAALLTASCAVVAQTASLQTGHARLLVPVELQPRIEPLPAARTGGEARNIEQKLLVLPGADRIAKAIVVIGATAGGSRYQWTGACERMRSDERRFVHAPFHTNRLECSHIAGPYDLPGSLDNIAPGARARLESGGIVIPEGGYVAGASYALQSGQSLSVLAFLPRSFRGLVGKPAASTAGSGLEPELIAWALALGEQVRGAMQAVSGEWQLPPIE